MPTDDDYEWLEMNEFGSAKPTYVQGPCLHRRVSPVQTRDGTVVAALCMNTDCYEQLPTTFLDTP